MHQCRSDALPCCRHNSYRESMNLKRLVLLSREGSEHGRKGSTYRRMFDVLWRVRRWNAGNYFHRRLNRDTWWSRQERRIPFDCRDGDLSRSSTKHQDGQHVSVEFQWRVEGQCTDVYPHVVLQQDSIASNISTAMNKNVSSPVAFERYINDSMCSEDRLDRIEFKKRRCSTWS